MELAGRLYFAAGCDEQCIKGRLCEPWIWNLGERDYVDMYTTVGKSGRLNESIESCVGI